MKELVQARNSWSVLLATGLLSMFFLLFDGEEELEGGRRRVGASRWAGGSMERRDDGEGWLLLGRRRSGGAGEGSRRWCWRESERIGASAGGAGRKMSGIRAAGGRGSCGWGVRRKGTRAVRAGPAVAPRGPAGLPIVKPQRAAVLTPA